MKDILDIVNRIQNGKENLEAEYSAMVAYKCLQIVSIFDELRNAPWDENGIFEKVLAEINHDLHKRGCLITLVNMGGEK